MRFRAAAAIAIALAMMTVRADAQARDDRENRPSAPPDMQSASDMYWAAVRASTGPIGFERHSGEDEKTRRFHARPRVFGPQVFASAPVYAASPDTVYVPVYVPGPIVYVPVPPAAAVPTPRAFSEPVTPAPRTPQTFYVIPGCYGGNRPPDPETLPAGCDIEKLRVSAW